ncbi:MAG TPA: BON domain-containing protein [Steroidobacteraceae bacterium]|jgi:hyperosmotically inducible protein|nr:BON domain-containing protein [Steroidobacteraceae bacterium]
MWNVCIALLAALVMAEVGTALGQPPDNSSSNVTAENSSNRASVADGQTNDAQDLMTTQSIRRSVMADAQLSLDAHNVKIVTVRGHVTLNGVVRSDAERASVAAKAVNVAGIDNVVNDLKVAPQS